MTPPPLLLLLFLHFPAWKSALGARIAALGEMSEEIIWYFSKGGWGGLVDGARLLTGLGTRWNGAPEAPPEELEVA